ncbi:MAG: hypothetical protein H6737_10840 [Alphaproteobacteria bacterium]|nr:hypothetical protein [Alphaproteobacteria bacterium]
MEHFLPVLVVSAASLAVALAIQNSLPGRLARLVVTGWVVHFLGVWANLAVTILVYRHGDALNYHRQGVGLAVDARLNPAGVLPELVKAMLQMDSLIESSIEGTDATASMVSAVALLCVVLADSLYAVSLLVGMLAFFGKLMLFLGIRDYFPKAQHAYLLGAILFVPSAVFWTGGIIKEAVVTFGLGTAGWGLSQAARRRSTAGLVVAGFGVAVTGLIKAYVVLTAVVALGAFLYWQGAVKKGRIEIRPIRLAIGTAVAIGGVLIVGSLFPRMSIGNLASEMAHLQDVGNRGGSGYSIGAGAEASLTQQLVFAPLALVTALYRPFLFEATNPQMLISALETTLGLILTLRAFRNMGFSGLREGLVRLPFLVFCIVFVGLTGVGVGLASANLGTLSRYRVPIVPFFAILVTALNAPEVVRAVAAPKVRVKRVSKVAAK